MTSDEKKLEIREQRTEKREKRVETLGIFVKQIENSGKNYLNKVYSMASSSEKAPIHGPTVKKHLSRDYVGLIESDER